MGRPGATWSVMLAIVWLVAPQVCADEASEIAPRLILLHPTNVHNAPVVTAASIQPGGRLLVTAGDDHQIRFWDLQTGKLQRRVWGHTDWIGVARFSPDGTTVATAGHDGQILLWDVVSGLQKGRFTHGGGAITSLEFSHDGQRLATTAFGHAAELFEVATGRLLQTLNCPCRDTRCSAFSPDDSLLAVAGRNGIIRVFDLRDPAATHQWTAHQQRIRDLIFTSDGQTLLSASEDRFIRGWRPADGQQLLELPQFAGKVLALELVAPHVLAAGGSDNLITLWDLNRLSRLTTLSGHEGSIAVLDARDGLLASGSFDTSIRIWSLHGSAPAEVSHPVSRTGR